MMQQNQLKMIVNASAEFAEKLGSRTVETEHLLFGVLNSESTMAAKILSGVGVTKTKYASNCYNRQRFA